jgi:tetratricopeptide (TPR) repeat protein
VPEECQGARRARYPDSVTAWATRSRVDLAGLALLALLVGASPGDAQTPLETAQALLERYHEDLTRIERARDLLAASVASGTADVPTLVTLARAWFLHGEYLARGEDGKLASFGRGRDLARRAVQLAPGDRDAHLWYAITLGSAAQTQGIARSLLVLRTIRDEVDTVLRLDPNSVEGLTLAASINRELPPLLGGDRSKAEEMFQKARALAPRLTGPRLELARLYMDQARYDEARRELQAILDEPAPADLPRWTLKEAPRARALLESIRGKH